VLQQERPRLGGFGCIRRRLHAGTHSCGCHVLASESVVGVADQQQLESACNSSTDGKPIFVRQLSVHVDICEGLATCVQQLDWTTGSAVWCCAAVIGRVSDAIVLLRQR
jgi:hypothetical protein